MEPTANPKEFYSTLTAQGKQMFLARVASYYTVVARSVDGQKHDHKAAIEALRGLNEVQHQLSQQITALGLELLHASDDGTFWKYLEWELESFGLSPEVLEEALQSASSAYYPEARKKTGGHPAPALHNLD